MPFFPAPHIQHGEKDVSSAGKPASIPLISG
jgi:hypothetical protein